MEKFNDALNAIQHPVQTSDALLNLFNSAKTLGVLTDLLRSNDTINVDVSSVYGTQTPLQVFAQEKNLGVVDILCEHGADVDNTYLGRTALQHVAANKDVEDLDMLCLLIDWGSQLDIQDNEGCTPSVLAAQANNSFILQILLMVGVNIHLTNKAGSDLREVCWEEQGACYQVLMDWVDSQKIRDSLKAARSLLYKIEK